MKWTKAARRAITLVYEAYMSIGSRWPKHTVYILFPAPDIDPENEQYNIVTDSKKKGVEQSGKPISIICTTDYTAEGIIQGA